MISIDNYMDWASIFMNEVVGGVFLAYFLICAFILYHAIDNRIPYQAIVSFLVIVSLGFVAFAYQKILLMIVILLVGLIAYAILGKVIRH